MDKGHYHIKCVKLKRHYPTLSHKVCKVKKLIDFIILICFQIYELDFTSEQLDFTSRQL
jgi:hypothetical protein